MPGTGQPVRPFFAHALSRATGGTSLPNGSTFRPNGATSRPNRVTLHPNHATSRPNDVTSHPNDVTSHSNNVTFYPNRITSHPNGGTSHANGRFLRLFLRLHRMLSRLRRLSPGFPGMRRGLLREERRTGVVQFRFLRFCRRSVPGRKKLLKKDAKKFVCFEKKNYVRSVKPIKR